MYFSKHLWQRSTSEPSIFKQWLMALLSNLKEIGLDFLANDLELLFSMHGNPQPIPKHWTNYEKEYSEVELNDPNSLRTLILGKAVEVNAVRVLLLGPGGAGKSTLADRLQGKAVKKIKQATKGIDYLDNQALNLNQSESAFAHLSIPDDLELYLWDFGGQTLFYGLHKSFLHENCVYVLVVDNRHEQAPDEWLQQIRHLSEGKRTAVMLVSNAYENCYNRQNESRLLREFNEYLKLSFYYLSCNNPKDENLNIFKQELLNIAYESRHFITQNLLETGNQLELYFNNRPIISYKQLTSMLEIKNLVTKNTQTIDNLLAKLKGLGRLVAIDTGGKRLCLDPSPYT